GSGGRRGGTSRGGRQGAGSGQEVVPQLQGGPPVLLLVGLGNPGPRYAGHRHNVGFMAADEIVGRRVFSPWRERFNGYVAEGHLGGERTIVLKPQTFMNESSRSVGEAVRYLKVPLGRMVVFHDELDLAPGRVRMKKGGGA